MWFAKLKKEGDELRLPPLPELGKKRVEKPELRVETARSKIDLAIEDVPKPPSEFELEDVPEPPSAIDEAELPVPSPPTKAELGEESLEPLPEPPEFKENTLPHYNFEDMATPQKVVKAEVKKETEKEATTAIEEPKFKVPETKPVPEIPSSSEETSLWLANGMTVKDINELATALQSMDDKTFHYHVSPEKNEIADWVADILHDESLAQKLAKVRKRKDTYNIVERAIGGPIIRKKKEKPIKPEPVSKRKKREIQIGKSPEASHAALEELDSLKPATEVISKKEKLIKSGSVSKKKKEEIKIEESPEASVAAPEELESIKPLPAAIFDKEKPTGFVSELETEDIKRKKSALNALKFTLTSLKPATDIIGRAFIKKKEKKIEILPALEEPRKEIKEAIEIIKEAPVIAPEIPKLEIMPPIPKLEIMPPAEIKKPAEKPLKKKAEKKKKLTKEEKNAIMKEEFKTVLQNAHAFIDKELFDEAKANILMAKRMFRKISLGKERKFLEYELYDLENKMKIESLPKMDAVLIIKE